MTPGSRCAYLGFANQWEKYLPQIVHWMPPLPSSERSLLAAARCRFPSRYSPTQSPAELSASESKQLSYDHLLSWTYHFFIAKVEKNDISNNPEIINWIPEIGATLQRLTLGPYSISLFYIHIQYLPASHSCVVITLNRNDWELLRNFWHPRSPHKLASRFPGLSWHRHRRLQEQSNPKSLAALTVWIDTDMCDHSAVKQTKSSKLFLVV